MRRDQRLRIDEAAIGRIAKRVDSQYVHQTGDGLGFNTMNLIQADLDDLRNDFWNLKDLMMYVLGSLKSGANLNEWYGDLQDAATISSRVSSHLQSILDVVEEDLQEQERP